MLMLRQRGEAANGARTEVIVVIVRNDNGIDGRQILECERRGKKRLAQAHCAGAARCSQMGSMSRRIPSISTSEVECPIQVILRPERGVVAKPRGSVWKRPSGCFGDRAAAPRKKRGPILTMSESRPLGLVRVHILFP